MPDLCTAFSNPYVEIAHNVDAIMHLTESAIVNGTLADMTLNLANQAKIGLVHVDMQGVIINENMHFQALNNHLGGNKNIMVPGFRAVSNRMIMQAKMITRPLLLEFSNEIRHFWVRYSPVMDSDNNVTGVFGAFQDWSAELSRINEAMRDKARFRDFARASSDWFWETDIDFRFTALSDRITALVGILASEFIGKPIDTLGRLMPNLNGEKTIHRARAEFIPFRDQLFEMLDTNGSIIRFHLAGVPLYDSEGKFRGYRGAGTDVTKSYTMEAETMRARQSLEMTMTELQRKNITLDITSGHAQTALKVKNEFLAAMSHELRTPLNAIIGFAEAMHLQVFGPIENRYASYAKDIENAGLHLLGLINDVLDVSVIESGDITLSRDIIDLHPLVVQAKALIALRADAKKINLDAVAIPENTLAFADERRALQILVNLLTNAVKFTPEKGMIGVDINPDVMAGRHMALTVWDTGLGVAAENHERIFEKFQQVTGEVYKGKPEGTGLGLHISRELARLMQGDITLESSIDNGSRFTVTLPLE